ncbi:hypothetical protein PG993_013793 [Apiospora rasikravindrae]|uniref:Epoxide hydrolase N-terminal domain-containing protein n=1 Tax=Apiospora rasikravindrae TaxID=990691 RepID=A0ABR1RRL2_9PEZI
MYGTFTDTTSIARIMAGDAQPDDAATTAGQNGSAHAPDEEVKPYQLHVSTKYIDLTQQKLEITRLPHEQSKPNSEDWWEPKPLVEPLVDYWLEQYEWRTEEAALNELPQFRTGFTIPNAEALSFAHILKSFTEPEDAATNQPFHLVIPSLPGLGFSDALPNNTAAISTSGEILNSLMNRLDYPHYLVTNAGSASGSPAQIDWKLASYLATNHPDSCESAPKESRISAIAAQFGMNNQLGLLQEPNTLAYALCDSPTGLLVFVLKYLKLLAPTREFTPQEIVNFTQLAWLPGPEAAMRFWAHSARHPESPESPKKTDKKSRPRVAITVFLGDEAEASGFESVQDAEAQIVLPRPPIQESYACPGWAKTQYKVVHAHRASGKPGLLAWERPELIVSGVRSLAKEILKLDSRLKPNPGPVTAPLEGVVAGDDATEAPPLLTALSSDSALLAPIPETEERHHQERQHQEREQAQRETSEDTRVASDNETAKETAKYPDERKRLLEHKSEETLAERPNQGRMYPLH